MVVCNICRLEKEKWHWQKHHSKDFLNKGRFVKGNPGTTTGCKFNGKICSTCGKTHPDRTGENNPSKRPEVRKKLSEANKGQKGWNKGLTKETDKRVKKNAENISITRLRRIKEGKINPFDCGLVNKSSEEKKVIYRRIAISRRNYPSCYEEEITRIIKKHNLPYKYTGDWTFTIGSKNPDFVNTNGEKIAIEVFYDFFKIQDYGSVKKYKKERCKIFKEYGWKTIFIGDNEIDNEELILEKIQRGQ